MKDEVYEHVRRVHSFPLPPPPPPSPPPPPPPAGFPPFFGFFVFPFPFSPPLFVF